MQVTTIGIIGAGTMGSGIAQVCAGAGLDVILTDVNETIVKKGAAAVAESRSARRQQKVLDSGQGGGARAHQGLARAMTPSR